MPVTLPYQLQPDDLLCFVHIGKTGGLTLLPILDSMFDPREVCPHHAMQFIKEMPQEARARFRLVRSHGTYGEFRALRQKCPIFMTFLRDPIQRSLSLYLHIRNQDPNHPLHETLQKLTFKDYVQADPDINFELHNSQTRVLTSIMSMKMEPDLELAKRRLREEFYFIGLTEAYETSLRLLSFTFWWPPITDYNIRNVSQKPDNSVKLLDENYEQLVALNSLDLQLYEYGRQLFEERVELMNRLVFADRIKTLFAQTRQDLEVIFARDKGAI